MNPSCRNKTWYRDWRLLYSWTLYVEFGGVVGSTKMQILYLFVAPGGQNL